MSIYEEIPKDLLEYLSEQQVEGNEVIGTTNEDGLVWLINQKELDDWIVVVSWYEGSEDWSVVNLCGDAYSAVFELMSKEK